MEIHGQVSALGRMADKMAAPGQPPPRWEKNFERVTSATTVAVVTIVTSGGWHRAFARINI